MSNKYNVATLLLLGLIAPSSLAGYISSDGTTTELSSDSGLTAERSTQSDTSLDTSTTHQLNVNRVPASGIEHSGWGQYSESVTPSVGAASNHDDIVGRRDSTDLNFVASDTPTVNNNPSIVEGDVSCKNPRYASLCAEIAESYTPDEPEGPKGWVTVYEGGGTNTLTPEHSGWSEYRMSYAYQRFHESGHYLSTYGGWVGRSGSTSGKANTQFKLTINPLDYKEHGFGYWSGEYGWTKCTTPSHNRPRSQSEAFSLAKTTLQVEMQNVSAIFAPRKAERHGDLICNPDWYQPEIRNFKVKKFEVFYP